MTPFDKLLQFLVKSWRLDIVVLSKLGVLLLLFLFFSFSLVVVRQVELMSRTVSTELDSLLKLAGKFLVALAVIAFIIGLIVL